MRVQIKKSSSILRLGLWLTVPMLTLGLCVETLHAAESELFEMDKTGWMSLERFTDKAQRFPPKPVVQEVEKQPSVASDTAAPTKETENAAHPVVAPPMRPLNMPVMPGLNEGYDVRVSSTEDDKDQAAVKLVDMETKPSLHLENKNWQKAEVAAKLYTEMKQVGVGKDHNPLNIRLAQLPNSSITPIPAGPATKTHPRGDIVQSVKTETAAAAKDKDPAVCAAISAFKKRQLQAIETDRKTLTDLQDAISSLGLGNKLNFMTDASGSLNAQGTESKPLMDMPVAAAKPTAKN